MGNWRQVGEIGRVYFLTEIDNERMGHCWMDGRIKSGDVALCIAHTGDCFNDYILLDAIENAVTGISGSKFGAYRVGRKLKWYPSNREFHLLCAGETIYVDATMRHPLTQELRPQDQQEATKGQE